MKIIVTGSNGQLGTDVMAELKRRNICAIGADLPFADITDYDSFLTFCKKNEPSAIIHLAAYTAVDKAESEKELCYKVNTIGTANVAKAAKEMNIKLLYTSTDYVFAGDGDHYRQVNEQKSPLNYYGETKHLGEEAIKAEMSSYFIVRTSWVFGKNGKNFISTITSLAKQGKALKVVNDQIGSPTYTVDLARLICDMIITDKFGVYHATNEGVCSWYDLAVFAIKALNLQCDITPVPSEEYPTPAKRPYNSRLSKTSLIDNGFDLLATWQNAVERFLKS